MKIKCPLCTGLRRPGPAISLLLLPLSWVYGAAVKVRLFLYSADILRSTGFQGTKVISIGNLTAGGTGKTPMTVLTASLLGPGVAVVSRGYGRRSAEPVQIVADGKGIIASYPEAADEALMCATELNNVPVICSPKRAEGIEASVKRFGAKTVILDDAFSHLRVKRDKNIVLLDALDPFGGGRLIPSGYLREPLSSLKRADAAVITRSNLVDAARLGEIREKIIGIKKMPVFSCDMVPDRILFPDGSHGPVQALRGEKVHLLSGIASPGQFEKTVSALGSDITGRSTHPDHHPFTDTEVREAVKAAGDSLLLTTHKDLIRIPHSSRGGVHVLLVKARVVEDEEYKKFLLS